MLENALSSGINAMGVDVLYVGPLPTPGVAFLTRSMRADAGIVISASHNSYEDNGIKIFGSNGFKFPDSIEDEIEALMTSPELEVNKTTGADIGKSKRIDDAVGRYTVFLKSWLNREFKLDGLKIALDTANGAAYKVAPLVFNELGAEVIKIGDNPDGININVGVGSLYPEKVARVVVDNKADIGVALDGDADRLILVDENGQVINGDVTLAVIALHLNKTGSLTGGGIVGTTMSNLGLELAMQNAGINLIRADVGDRYIIEKMLEGGYNLGGEQSGHIITLDYNTTGDGILSALLFISIMLETKKKASELAQVMAIHPQTLINIKVAKKIPLDTLSQLQTEITKAEQELGNTGRLLIRYSGTENKLRVMVEAQDAKLCEEIAKRLAGIAEKELG